jgi:hypothetical protein
MTYRRFLSIAAHEPFFFFFFSSVLKTEEKKEKKREKRKIVLAANRTRDQSVISTLLYH